MSIRQEIVKGVFWSAVEKYSGVIVSLIISAVLARLISPKDFGVISIATVVINFLTLFTTMGIYPAIIQRNDLTKKNLDSIFTFSILGGIVLAILFFFLSEFISDFYDNKLLIPICRILSINLLFAALNLVPNALMAKNKKFKEIAQRTLSLQLLSGIISIIAAYQGLGVYALLISPVITSIGIFLFNMHYYSCSIDFTFDTSPLKKIFSYSAYQFMFDFVNYFSRNFDKLIIGKYMNMSALGYYDKSYRLMMLPLQNVTSVISPVIQPVFTSLQDNKEELAMKYNRIVKFISMISFPLSVFLYYTAYELIRIVYGSGWDAAIPTFRILSISLTLQMILSTCGAIFQVSNATNHLFFTGLRNSVVTVVGFLISVHFFSTIEAIAWAWNITLFINFITTYTVLYCKVLNSSFFSMLNVLKLPFINSILLILTFSVLDYLNVFNNVYLILFIKLLLFLVVTLSFLHYTNQFRLQSILTFFSKK